VKTWDQQTDEERAAFLETLGRSGKLFISPDVQSQFTAAHLEQLAAYGVTVHVHPFLPAGSIATFVNADPLGRDVPTLEEIGDAIARFDLRRRGVTRYTPPPVVS
jgi:hypothetical protein